MKMKTVDGLYHEKKIPCSLYKNEHSSTNLPPCLQMSSISLRHFLVLNSHRVVDMRLSQQNEKESSSNDPLTIRNSHYFISKTKMR